jgi:hypothetical protein
MIPSGKPDSFAGTDGAKGWNHRPSISQVTDRGAYLEGVRLCLFHYTKSDFFCKIHIRAKFDLKLEANHENTG